MINDFLRWNLLPRVLKRIVPGPRGSVPCRPASVVCLRPGKLGDLIVATPLFHALKCHGVVRRLAVICSAENEPVIRHNPAVDDRRVVNFHRADEVLAVIGWLRRQRFEAILDLTPGFSRTNFIICQLSGPAVRGGIGKGALSSRYHCTIEDEELHLCERMLLLGAAVTGVPFPEAPPLQVFCGEEDERRADKFMRDHAAGAGCIALNLSAGAPERLWGFDNARALAAALADRCRAGSLRLLVFSVNEEQAWATALAAEFPFCIAVPRLAFLTVTAILGRCSLLISPDTALVHAAAAAGVPVVGLFAAQPQNTLRWKPWGVKCRVLQSSRSGSIEDIRPSSVAAAACELMEETGGRG